MDARLSTQLAKFVTVDIFPVHISKRQSARFARKKFLARRNDSL